MLTIKRLLQRNRYFLLLLSLVLFFITSAIIADFQQKLFIFGIAFAIVLMFSVYIIEHNFLLLVAGIVLALAVLLSNYYSIVFHAKPSSLFIMFEYGVTIIFFVIVSYLTLASVMRDKIITKSTLFGAVCSYLLIGLTYSFWYMLLFDLNPAAFSLPQRLAGFEADIRLQNFIYYSYVTMSTLGYGDITPVSYLAKTSAWLESVIGQIYLTVWIARLVGLNIAHGTVAAKGNNDER